MSKKLSVVTIAKNEEANIAACVNSAKGRVDERGLDRILTMV